MRKRKRSTLGTFNQALKNHYDYWSRPHTPEEQALQWELTG